MLVALTSKVNDVQKLFVGKMLKELCFKFMCPPSYLVRYLQFFMIINVCLDLTNLSRSFFFLAIYFILAFITIFYMVTLN